MTRGALLACLGLACGPRPLTDEFILARVSWENGVTARCFVVRASAEGRSPRTSLPMVPGADVEELDVGIYRDDDPREITLEALGFADEGCLEPTGEHSEPKQGTFVKRGAKSLVELEVVVPIVMGVDVDGDGVPTPEDCDDGNARVRPGSPEACGDTFDNDCDGAIDCLDPDCPGKSCGVGLSCRSLVCAEDACGNNIDDDLDGQTDCADQDCDLRMCGGGAGTCRFGPDGGCQ